MELFQIIKAVSRKTWKIQLRYRMDTISLIFRPFLCILPYVLLGNYLFADGGKFIEQVGTENYKLYIVLSMIFMNFITNTIGFTMGTVADELQQGVMENILVLPIHIELYWCIELLFSMLFQVVTSVILLFVSCLLLGIRFELFRPEILLLAVMISMLFNIGIGIFLSGVTLKTKMTKMAYLVLSLIVFLAGEFYPVSSFPMVLKIFAYLNPVTYLTDIVRYSVLHTYTYLHITAEILLALFGGILLCGLGIYKYRRIVADLKRKGNLTNY